MHGVWFHRQPKGQAANFEHGSDHPTMAKLEMAVAGKKDQLVKVLPKSLPPLSSSVSDLVMGGTDSKLHFST